MDWALLEQQLQSVYFELSTKTDRANDARINSAYAAAFVQDVLKLGFYSFDDVPLQNTHATIKGLIDEAYTTALSLQQK